MEIFEQNGSTITDNLCPACEGHGVIYWDQYSDHTISEIFFGGFVPKVIGTKKDDHPCPMCDGSGLYSYKVSKI